MLLIILMGLAMTVSCSKDDDDDGNKTEYSHKDSGGNNTPRYEQKECTSCRGTGYCKLSGLGCDGTGYCSACNGRGYNGSGSFSVKCYRCNGNRICQYCKGTGICSTCDGLGYKEVEVKPDNNSDNSGSDDEYISITAVKIKAIKLSAGNWEYEASTVSMYKKTRFDGQLQLYSIRKNLISNASTNNDRDCGGYNVSSYTYKVLTDVDLHSKTYYYFD